LKVTASFVVALVVLLVMELPGDYFDFKRRKEYAGRNEASS